MDNNYNPELSHHLIIMELQKNWRDANDRPIEYDGSPIDWRISCYAIIVRDQQILVMSDVNNYLYTVPGGGIELDEPLKLGLEREVAEETGSTVEVGQLISVKEDWFYHAQEQRFYHAVLNFYSAELAGEVGQPTDAKVNFADFVPLSQLKAENTNPLVWEVLKQNGYL